MNFKNRSLLIVIILLAIAVKSIAQTDYNQYFSQNKTLTDKLSTRDTSSDKKAVISWVYTSIFGSGLEMAIEPKLKKRTTIRLSVGYYANQNAINSYSDNVENMIGYKAEMQIRKYITNKDYEVLNGIYIGLFGNYRHISFNATNDFIPSGTTKTVEENATITATNSTVGPLLGIQLINELGLSFDVFLGPMIAFEINETNSGFEVAHLGTVNPYQSGIYLKFGSSIGYAF